MLKTVEKIFVFGNRSTISLITSHPFTGEKCKDVPCCLSLLVLANSTPEMKAIVKQSVLMELLFPSTKTISNFTGFDWASLNLTIYHWRKPELSLGPCQRDPHAFYESTGLYLFVLLILDVEVPPAVMNWDAFTLKTYLKKLLFL